MAQAKRLSLRIENSTKITPVGHAFHKENLCLIAVSQKFTNFAIEKIKKLREEAGFSNFFSKGFNE